MLKHGYNLGLSSFSSLENSSKEEEDAKARETPSHSRTTVTAEPSQPSPMDSDRRITRSQTRQTRPLTNADLGIVIKPLKRLQNHRRDNSKITRRSTRQRNAAIQEQGRRSRKNQTHKQASR